MKNLLLIFSVLLSTSLSAVEYGQLLYNQSFTLEEGDAFEILAFPPYSNSEVKFKVNGNQVLTGIGNRNSQSWPMPTNYVLVGPGEVVNTHPYISYKLTRASEIQYQNGNIVSVPSDVQGAGSHNIVVETSSDLINWTPVHSSAISGGSEAFVRTRISTSE